MLRSRRRRMALLLAAAASLALTTYAFTASDTVPGSKAGKGEGTISGYTVSAVAYTLSASNPANIDSVEAEGRRRGGGGTSPAGVNRSG